MSPRIVGVLAVTAALVGSSGCAITRTVHELHEHVAREERDVLRAETPVVAFEGRPAVFSIVDEYLTLEREDTKPLVLWSTSPSQWDAELKAKPDETIIARFGLPQKFPPVLPSVHEAMLLEDAAGKPWLVCAGREVTRYPLERYRLKHNPARPVLWAVPFAPVYLAAAVGDIVTAPFLAILWPFTFANMARD